MKTFHYVCLAPVLLAAQAFAAVTVTSPSSGASVTSPVHYVATATAPSCAKGVASMGIYVNNVKVYVVSGHSLNYQLTLAAGNQHTVVEEWDYCKGASYTTINLTVKAAAAAAQVTLTASPTSIKPGQSSTLAVVASNATQVTLTGTDGSTYALPVTGGTQVVSPAKSTTYTATGTSTAGNSTATATVTVASPAAPAVSIGASPASISAGGSSTLTVSASNATQVTISGSDGTAYTLAATGGTQVVSPKGTATYTATATGAGGTSTASTIVTLLSAPTIGISASPASIASGGSSTLTVSAGNATQVTISGSDGTAYTLAATGGTQVVSPRGTTTYTATASGRGGTSTASTIVSLLSAPSISVSASPASIASGGSATLTVSAANATQVTISGSDGSGYTLAATGGTQVVSPKASTTYTATATGTGGKSTATTTVAVTVPAATVSISAKPASITSGSSSTLTVAATNATQVVVSGSDSSSYTLQAAGGSVSVNPTSTTTYTATATGGSGNVTATVTVTVTAQPAATVTLKANPSSIFSGGSATLTVTATNATGVTITGTDQSSYTLAATGGTQSVTPTVTTTYTATALGNSGNATAQATVTVNAAGSAKAINHVVFMLQENHTFDDYFGMLNPYRKAQGWNIGDDGNDYEVDGIDDKLTTISLKDDEGTSFTPFKLASTCIDDDSSDWLASYGDINRYDFLNARPINMDGFVHTAEGYAKNCASTGLCSGTFTDLTGQRAMGYYDQGFLNYYYYMASQFAVSNRWFSPLSSKSVPNRIATFSGGTTQGLVFDPGTNDHLPTLNIPTIFSELDKAGVSWKIYYTVTDGYCLSEDDCGTGVAEMPSTAFTHFSYSYQYVYENTSQAACIPPAQASSVVGDPSNSFCIDPQKIAPLSQYYSDLANGTLPSFSFIEAGFGVNDEHPGSGESVLSGQAQVANVVNSLMTSSSWSNSVFFLSYDEGGGPYDHVPPVPGHSNDNTDASLGSIADISSIAVNPDVYNPCLPAGSAATIHCDLLSSDPGANAGDAPAVQGFAAQLGFRLPNIVISPFTRRHYVSNVPMDHTAVIRFVEDRFIGNHQYLTARDAAQPNLLDFFDFNNVPWATPPTPPQPVSQTSLGYNPCTPGSLGP